MLGSVIHAHGRAAARLVLVCKWYVNLGADVWSCSYKQPHWNSASSLAYQRDSAHTLTREHTRHDREKSTHAHSVPTHLSGIPVECWLHILHSRFREEVDWMLSLLSYVVFVGFLVDFSNVPRFFCGSAGEFALHARYGLRRVIERESWIQANRGTLVAAGLVWVYHCVGLLFIRESPF